MYDIHCHLLPGIDDGSPSLDYSIDMARFAVEHGTTHMVVTPHIHPGRYDNNIATISSAFESFKNEINRQNIALQVAMSAEVRFSAEILLLFQQGEIPFYHNSNDKIIMLLELPHDQVPPGCEKLINWLLERNCQPVIAHPERNKGIMREPKWLNTLKDQGCLAQLTAGSLVGSFGPAVQQIAEQFLHDGLIDIIASDAHNLTHRTPDLSAGYAKARELTGEETADQLFVETPKRITGSLFG
ncbi:MAG: capsular biosynthesis protein [Gammaproteobacteria bacterium]|nr:capsular biosynthesis protein [Gammaproteobacteria bacterium]